MLSLTFFSSPGWYPDVPCPLDIGSGDGFVVGGQIGYNWQLNYWVLGLEADGSFVDNSDEGLDGFSEQNFLASIRGRVGFAVDRFLIYGTGGAAWTGFDVDFVTDGLVDDEVTFFGWVAGGGIEYAITDNVTFGVEYLHYEFDDEAFTDNFDASPPISTSALPTTSFAAV